MTSWYEHVAAVLFVTSTLLPALIFRGNWSFFGAYTLLICLTGVVLYLIIGIAWMIAKRASLAALLIFLSSLLYLASPLLIVYSGLSIVPVCVCTGVGLSVISGSLLFSKLLQSTSRPGLFKTLLIGSAVVYAGGALLGTYYMNTAIGKSASILEFGQQLSIGSFVSTGAAVCALIAFEFARYDHEKTVRAADAEAKEPLLSSGP